MSHLGWRWTEYLTAIMIFFFGIVAFLVIPETLESTLLRARAKMIRFETKNWALHAKAEELPIDTHSLVTKYLILPCKMLVTEWILLLITIYMSIIYGMTHLSDDSVPI